MIFMKTLRAINWKSSFKTRIGEMRTVRQLDVGKDFLKQDYVCCFILNLSGFQPFWRTVFLVFLANLGSGL